MKRMSQFGLVVLIFLGQIQPATAGNFLPPSGDWMTPGNWDTASVPAGPGIAPANRAVISGGRVADYNNAGPNTFGVLLVGSVANAFGYGNAGGAGTLNVTGGVLEQSDAGIAFGGIQSGISIGVIESGTITVSNSATLRHVGAGDVFVGAQGGAPTHTGTLTVRDNATFNNSNNLRVANFGSNGVVNVEDNATFNNSSNLWIGGNSGLNGVVNVQDNAVLTAPSIVVGNGASGLSSRLSVSGAATVTANSDLRVGTTTSGPPATLSVGGSGGAVNVGSNLTFDHANSALEVHLTNPTSFNTINANTTGGTIVGINPLATLDINLDIDLGPGAYAWTILNKVSAGAMQRWNGGIIPGPAEFAGFADGSSFTVFSSTTNTPYLFTINYDGGNGNDLVLSTSVVTPEPSSLAIWGCGLGLVAYRFRKRARNRRAAA